MTTSTQTPQDLIQAEVVSISPLTPTVSRVLLKPQQAVDFQAGQYLQIWLSDQDKRPFSIASAPNDEFLELHIGGAESNSYASQALTHLQQNPVVRLQVGLGQAQLRLQSERPVILLAGGTGFSYVYSIAKTLSQQANPPQTELYWGLRNEAAFYFEAELAALKAHCPQLKITLVIQEPSSQWQGKTGLVHQAVMADIPNLENFDIYIAGPFPMVKAVRDDFLNAGATKEQMYADAFAWI